MSNFFQDSVFWVETEKIKPNPYQPRREFSEEELKSLSESIRQYGLLQALVVTRTEVQREDGGLQTEYELISGERRLRASRLAGLSQVPVLIKSGEQNNLLKLELAIIENVQREDLNAVDRARAFDRLASEFGLKHIEIAKKIGKSREYVSNTMRILALPSDMLEALGRKEIAEGHTRPLLMLIERPDEQRTLFKEIIHKKTSVREAELIARGIAFERARKKEPVANPEMAAFENQLAERLGTRVKIESREKGGRIQIDFFSAADLQTILDMVKTNERRSINHMLEEHVERIEQTARDEKAGTEGEESEKVGDEIHPRLKPFEPQQPEPKREIDLDNDDMYSVSSFSL